MVAYQCPLCGNQMPRDLILYLDHTQGHIIDQIKQEHPEWVEADGVCKPCAEYFKKQISGEGSQENIGPRGRQRRFVMGVWMLVVALALVLFFIGSGFARSWRLALFLPAFFGMLGLIQAREKTCAFLAEQGLRNMDAGEGKIGDAEVARSLKIRGRKILIKSLLWAALLTALSFLFP